MEVYYQNAMQFHNKFILKLQYICSHFTTLYFKDTFSCIVKLHFALVINFHYIYCKITIDIFNSVGMCTVRPSRAPHAEERRSVYSRRRPGFFKTPATMAPCVLSIIGQDIFTVRLSTTSFFSQSYRYWRRVLYCSSILRAYG